MTKHKNSINEPLSSNKGKIALCLIFALMLTIPISLALAISSIQSPTLIQPPGSIQPPDTIQTPSQTSIPTAPHVVAYPQTQFQVHVAYAYVGPAPSNVSTYFEKGTDTTMHLFTQYPSVIRLNITLTSQVQFPGSDAVVEVYGIKIAADTGPAEYRAYFMGTTYDSSLSNASLSTLIQYVPDLYNASLYSNLAGNFKFKWDTNKSFLTDTLGTITSYTNSPVSALGLFGAGKPNSISVTVYRIGYVTMTNSSVSIFEDPLTSAPKDVVQLGSYESGFLYNDLVPSAQLTRENLFRPVA